MKKKFISAAAVLLLVLIELAYNQLTLHPQSKSRLIKKYNPLHKAILSGNIKAVKKYSKKKYFYYSDSNTELPLELAFRNDRIDLAKIMIKKGLKVDAPDYFGKRVIFLTVCNYKWFSFLLKHGANKNRKSSNLGGLSLLHLAAVCDHSKSLKLLLKKRAKKEIRDVSNGTPLFYAVAKNKLKNAKILIDAKAKIEYGKGEGRRWTLGVAIRNDNYDMVKLLLEKRHPIKKYTEQIYSNLVSKKQEYTKSSNNPVSLNNRNSIKIFNLLLKKGLSPRPIKRYTCSALTTEKDLARLWLTKYWKKYNWSVTKHTERYGNSLLSCANDENLSWLLKNWKWEISPLPIFASKGRLDKIKEYLKNGYSINGKDSNGRTALFYAADPNINKNILDFLLQKNADPNILDKKGYSIYSYPNNMMKLNPVYIKKILKAGFNPKLKDKKGNSAIKIAQLKCSRHFSRPYSRKNLENCVDTISLLSGKNVSEIIPSVCRNKFTLSRSQKRYYKKRSDGYYRYWRGKYIKADIDPCGKYRQYRK